MWLRGGGDRVFFFGKINVEIIVDPTHPVVYQTFWAVLGSLGHIGSAEPWGLFQGPKMNFFTENSKLYLL